MRLELIRHGQTDWNLADKLQGSSDIPLNDTGRGQALEAAGLLAGVEWSAIVSSPLGRARETAEIIAGEPLIAISAAGPHSIMRRRSSLAAGAEPAASWSESIGATVRRRACALMIASSSPGCVGLAMKASAPAS